MRLHLALHLPRDAASVPVVRRICGLTLEALGVGGEDVDDVSLALTEACANAIDHAARGHDYDVDLQIDGSTCTIRVTDRGGRPAATEVLGPRRMPGSEELATSGRGIALMESLMDARRFQPVDGGTSVELVKRLHLTPDSPLLDPAD